jgi:hypothetical protein
MCIETFLPLEEIAGYGYKAVTKTDDPIIFLPYFSGFGCSKPPGYFWYDIMDGRPIVESIYYKILRSTIVKNPKMIYTRDQKSLYPAGIHLYKKLYYSEIYANSMISIIKCHYRKVVAHDNNVIVALEVTPVEIIE